MPKKVLKKPAKMARRRKNAKQVRKIDRAEYAQMWAENKIEKKPTRQIAKEHGRAHRTTARIINKFDDFIRESPQFKKVGPAIAKMIPKALNLYDTSMENRDERGNVDMVGLRAADNVLKISGVLVDKRKDEVTGKDGGPIQVDIHEVKEQLKNNLKQLLNGNIVEDGQSGDDDESR